MIFSNSWQNKNLNSSSNFHSLSLNKFNQNVRWYDSPLPPSTGLMSRKSQWVTSGRTSIFGHSSLFCELSSEGVKPLVESFCTFWMNHKKRNLRFEMLGQFLLSKLYLNTSEHWEVQIWPPKLSTSQGATGVESAVSPTCFSERDISRGHSWRVLFRKFPSWRFQIQAKWKNMRKSNWIGSQIRRGEEK